MASTINNGIPLINGMLYSWADIVATINGVPLTGITGIEYGDSQDVVNKYGAGRHPVGRAKGRITPTAKIILYQEEVETIQSQSPNGRIQDLAPFDITVTYLPDSGIIKMDKGRHGTGSGTRTRSVAYRMGKIVADFNNKSIWKITNRNSRRERPTTAV